MKKIRTNQKGFELVGVLIVLVVLTVIVFVGYRAVNGRISKTSLPAASTSSAIQLPSKIKSKADVQQASKSLDADSADKQLNPAQLDKDLTSLL